MQFWLVAGILFVFFGEIDDFDGPRHAACAQHIDDTKIIEFYTKS